MSQFSNAISTGLDAIKGVAGVPVVYVRGTDSVDLTAVPAGTTFQVTDKDGVTSWERGKDYIFAASDLVLSGDTVLPQRNDKIKETIGGKVFVWTTTGSSTARVYRFSDPAQTTIRLSMKLDKVEG